jgi:hypothetical protein
MAKGFEMNSCRRQLFARPRITTIAPLELIGPLHTILQWALAIVVVVRNESSRARENLPGRARYQFATLLPARRSPAKPNLGFPRRLWCRGSKDSLANSETHH